MKLLLTHPQLRKTLAAARSLGARGVPVYVADTTRFSPAAFSRYCQRSLLSPDPDDGELRYIQWLVETMEREQIEGLFPMDDNAMQAVISHIDDFGDAVKAVLPDSTSYAMAADKGASVKAAERAGIPVPQTLALNATEDWQPQLGDLHPPWVIKPRRSSGSRGIRIVNQINELESVYRQIHELYPEPLLQEYIPTGERYDVCLLYDEEGKLKASYVQKELRHFPLERGPSTLQESVHRPDLVELAVCLMKQLPWRGVVEVEFMIDPRDGVPKLMEINPRFWNSLYTSILAGIDFPWMLYRIACGAKIDPVFDYPAGVRCRNLLPSDMVHYIANPRRNELSPSFWTKPAKGGGQDDILSLRDPLPTIGFALACVRYVADPKAWRFFFKR